MMPRSDRYERQAIEFARALTFFDAVYAFAVTLLITAVDNFTGDAWAGPRALWEANGAALINFTISFVVVVRFWMLSHRTLATFRYLDNRVIGLSILGLFGVVLLPFSTEAMGRLRQLPLPVAVYALDVVLVSVMQLLVMIIADRRDLRDRRLSKTEIRQAIGAGATIPVVFLSSIVVAYVVSPDAARLSWLSLLVLAPAVAKLIARRWPPEPAKPLPFTEPGN